MNKKLKIILIAVIILAVLACVCITIKVFINKKRIKTINKNVQNYSAMKNYAITIKDVVVTDGEESVTTTNYYQKNGQYVMDVVTQTKTNDIRRIVQYKLHDKNIMLMELNEDKYYYDNNQTNKINISGVDTGYNDSKLLEISLKSNIRTKIVNGKKCYEITYKSGKNKEITYYEIETGLKIQSKTTNTLNDSITTNDYTYIYEFNKVEDSHFEIPDLTGYAKMDNGGGLGE